MFNHCKLSLTNKIQILSLEIKSTFIFSLILFWMMIMLIYFEAAFIPKKDWLNFSSLDKWFYGVPGKDDIGSY